MNSTPGTTSDSTGSFDDAVDGDFGGNPTDPPSCQPGRLGCTDLLDVLIVVDNSSTMALEQRTLVAGLADLVEELRTADGIEDGSAGLDVQVMVTTTDMGNPLCPSAEPGGYEPASGMPVTTACTARLDHFTDPTGTLSTPEVCLDLCPASVEPTDPFLAFSPDGSNVLEVLEVDIDGDGDTESAEAQALACLGAVGIRGCRYASPLEAMLQALNPEAPHNNGEQPFLRDDAVLAVFVITDEPDCSVVDYTIMEDPAYQNVDPATGLPAPSSAICWNAGVECGRIDALGVYDGCGSSSEPGLHTIDRYADFLGGGLGNKDVVMATALGVPPVTMHNPDPPFQPFAGGEYDLVYRQWRDPELPLGDIQPDEWAAGVVAATKQFEFGIGPGCTALEGEVDVTARAMPPARLLDVCHSLDVPLSNNDPLDIEPRCCVESICGGDYVPALRCVLGVIGSARIDDGPGMSG